MRFIPTSRANGLNTTDVAMIVIKLYKKIPHVSYWNRDHIIIILKGKATHIRCCSYRRMDGWTTIYMYIYAHRGVHAISIQNCKMQCSRLLNSVYLHWAMGHRRYSFSLAHHFCRLSCSDSGSGNSYVNACTQLFTCRTNRIAFVCDSIVTLIGNDMSV